MAPVYTKVFSSLAFCILIPSVSFSEKLEVPLAVSDAPMPTVLVAQNPRPARTSMAPEVYQDAGISDYRYLTWKSSPDDFIRAWKDEVGVERRSRGNVVVLVDPELTVFFDQEVPWEIEGIGSRREFSELAISALNRLDDGNYYMAISYPEDRLEVGTSRRHRLPGDRSLLLWDEKIRTLEDFSLWLLHHVPQYRLDVNFIPVDEYPRFGMAKVDEDDNPIFDEDGNMMARLPRGLDRDFRDRYNYVVEIMVHRPRAIPHEYRFSSHVEMTNWDLFPDMAATDILETLAASRDPAMFERLMGTARLIPARLLDDSPPEVRAVVRIARELGDLREIDGVIVPPPLQDFTYDPDDPFDLLIMARVAAWRGEVEAISLSREMLKHKASLEGDWKRFHADTLRIYELRSGEQ